VREVHPFARDPIEARRATDFVSIRAEVVPRGVVRDAQENVGPRIGGGQVRDAGQENQEQE
jgi:hypothetical protein